MKRKGCMLLAGLLLCGALTMPAAADVETDAQSPETGVYCFSHESLEAREDLQGVFLTAVPEADCAVLRLGSRALRVGDAVARVDLARLRLEPTGSGEAAVCYLPLEGGHIGEQTVLTFHFQTAEDDGPVAKDGELETWRDLPNTGKLRAEAAREGELRFRLESRPRRGSVELAEDGSFTYTPRRNVVGEDSFRFTVTDAAGRVSEPATVKITIRKPTDAQTYADLDRDAQFEALWLREAGLFGGELISDRLSFGPEKTVSRGDYLAMVMELAGVDPEIGLQVSGFADAEEAASWLRPYLASALRRGWIKGESGPAGLLFRPNDPITQGEAVALTARVFPTEAALPVALTDAPNVPLTRMQAARLLYEAAGKE